MSKNHSEKTHNFFTKNLATILILSSVCSSMLWMNGKFNQVDKDIVLIRSEMNHRFSQVDREIVQIFSDIQKDMAVIKTVLLMKNILPSELANE